MQIECKFSMIFAFILCTQTEIFECKLSANRVQVECKFSTKSTFLICTLHSICAQFAVQRNAKNGDSTLPCTQFAVLPSFLQLAKTSEFDHFEAILDDFWPNFWNFLGVKLAGPYAAGGKRGPPRLALAPPRGFRTTVTPGGGADFW